MHGEKFILMDYRKPNLNEWLYSSWILEILANTSFELIKPPVKTNSWQHIKKWKDL
jgi:hypothetical protein